MGDDFGQVKDAILRSGLPLEHTVEEILRVTGWSGLSPDFAYSRVGSSADREVDMVAKQLIEHGRLERGGPDDVQQAGSWYASRHAIFECKYRRPGVSWLFAPYLGPKEPYKWYGPEVQHRGYLLVRNGGSVWHGEPVRYIDPKRFLSVASADELKAFRLPVAARGVVVRTDSKEKGNESELRAAAQQIRFALMPFIWSTLADQVEQFRGMSFGEITPAAPTWQGCVFSSFLVTTASLRLLRPDVDVQRVLDANSLDDLADPVDAVELLTFLSDELQAHNRGALQRFRDWSSQDLSDSRTRRFFDYWEPIASALERASPSVFVVALPAVRHIVESQRLSLYRACRQALGEAVETLDGGYVL